MQQILEIKLSKNVIFVKNSAETISRMTKHRRTTEVLQEIADGATKEAISLKDFNSKLGDRSFGLGLFVFGLLNFLPLLSIVFAIPVIFISIQMIIGYDSIKLPRFLENKTFNERTLARLIEKYLPYISAVETYIKPRLDFMTSVFFEKLVGIVCLLLGIIILAPIPGANGVPAICICMMAAAIMEKDGLLILISILLSIATAYLIQAAVIAIISYVINFISSLG